MKKISIVVLLFLTAVINAQLQVRNFFSVTGKKDVAVLSTAQDARGFLWLGTSEGVFRFDGRSAEQVLKDEPKLSGRITALCVNGNTLWAGTAEGRLYGVVDERRLDSLHGINQQNTEKITSIAVMDSLVLVSTYGNGVFIHSDSLTHVTAKDGLSDDVVYRIIPSEGSFWCATDAGITRMKRQGTRYVPSLISHRHGLPDNIVRDIFYSDRKLIVAMQDSGLCYLNILTQKFERLDFFTAWSHGPILNVCATADGKLIAATERNGVFIVDNGVVKVCDYKSNHIQGITGMLCDNTGQVWISSQRGISLFSERRYSFINSQHGLSDNRVLTVVSDHDHNHWIGTSAGIIRITTSAEGNTDVKNIPGLEKYTISCAALSANGDLWFGTYGYGIIVFDPVSGIHRMMNTTNSKLSNDNISGIHFTGDSLAYIATLGGGLNGFELENGRANALSKVAVYNEENGFGSDYVYSVITNSAGVPFAATEGGGLQYQTPSGFKNLLAEHQLKSSTAWSIARDSLQRIWLTTNADGLVCFDGKSVTARTRTTGLRDEQPQQIAATREGLYILHSRGIDKLHLLNNDITYYDVAEGDLDPNLNAICFDGVNLFCGTANGLLVFRAKSIAADSVKPVAFIRSAMIDYKPASIDSLHELEYDQNNLSLFIDGVWLRNPDKLSFRYRLAPIESEWMFAREGKQVNYNNLAPGNYTFILQAKNDEDVWSEAVTKEFKVLTPIWQRWWFWALVIVISFAAVYGFVRYRLQALHRENLLLERRVKERTAEIERQKLLIEEKNVELEQLSLVASKTDNSVLILDSDGRFEYVNDSFQKYNRLPENGETIFELSNHPGIKELVTEAVSQKKSVNYESQSSLQDARTWQSSTLTPIFDEKGALKKLIIIDTDVTERKRQEQIIVQKNKDITDSISYAKKIQHAILPDLRLIENDLPHSFVFYLTKDIVSGDFYWFNHFEGFSIIAAVDCTGHGVPGAFMSLIGYNLLNRIINEKNITALDEILAELNNGVVEALNKKDAESRDGMDIAVCKIIHGSPEIEYAGAMRPLWIVRQGAVTELKADKIPIGTRSSDRDEPLRYHSHRITAAKGDWFYIFTDGYADQFGGDKDKKFSSARFRDLLSKSATLPAKIQQDFLRTEHLRWKGDNEQVDDILVIGFCPVPSQ